MATQQNLFAYLARQKQDFIKGFKEPAGYPVGVQDPAQTSRSLSVAATWCWDPAVPQNAFVRTVAGHDDEYWVRTDFQDYREAFLAFLGRRHGVARASVPGALHADHLLNKAFALRHGLRYVRMALVWADYNVGYGSKIEKNLTKSDAQGKPIYLIDYIILMKVLNIPAPIDANDYKRRREEIASRLEAEGAESRELALQGMDGFFKLWQVI